MKTTVIDQRLTDLKLGKDNEGYFLTAKYLSEDNHRVTEITIPKIRLPLRNYPSTECEIGVCGTHHRVDLGFGMLPMCLDDKLGYFIEKVIEEKVTEMTLAEVEKKLGYKVKIVSEK